MAVPCISPMKSPSISLESVPSALTLSDVLVLGAWILFDEDEHTDVLRVLVGWIWSNGGINVLRGSVTSDDWEYVLENYEI